VRLSPPHRAATVFVLSVIGLCPLIAMWLLWTSRVRTGLVLLTLSMAGSLLFGLYHHFVAMSPDHAEQHFGGLWATTFAISAYGLIVVEAPERISVCTFLFATNKE
jgi:hypothetical protein